MSFDLSKFLKSKLFSKRTKTRLHTVIIRRLKVFTNKMGKIYRPFYDRKIKGRKRKFNKELQEKMEVALVIRFVRGQRIQ